MTVKRIGLDLAKSVFQVHGVDERERVVVRKRLKRSEVLGFFAPLPACQVGMGACGSAHYWARQLQGLGHEVRLLAPRFVTPYRKNDKTTAMTPRPCTWPSAGPPCASCPSRTNASRPC